MPDGGLLHVLVGCRPQPLGSYLKALGVLRLVGTQADPQALGWWEGERYLMRSVLDRDALVAFFVDDYRPTPLVAPWNGGSGFGPTDRQGGIEAIETSTAPRLDAYREAIRVGHELFGEAREKGWAKQQLLEACRARLPDDAVAWMDACVVLAEGGPGFPPLLGTGGNDGRLEFSNTFMQRLVDVLSLRVKKGRRTVAATATWLNAALFADREAPGVLAPVGQFDPGAAGGANSSPLGARDSLLNPWDWVLLLEGALLFAGAVARRLGAGARGRATMPFTFDASPVGYPGAAPVEKARGEIWVPLWRRPTTVAELSQLFGEARADWRGRPARRGLDMVRAVASLGVDRGIDAFGRFAVVERFGRNNLAVQVDRVRVRTRTEVPLTADLDRWLEPVRRAQNPPAAVDWSLRRTDGSIYELAVRGGPHRLQVVLTVLADLELAVGRATVFRENSRLRPVHGLRAADWLPHLDDGSLELRIAVALASGRDRDGAGLRSILRPVARDGRGWTEGPEPVPGLGVRPLAEVLAGAHARRAIEAAADVGGEGAVDHDGIRLRTAFRYRVPASTGDVQAFVEGRLDEDRLGRLLSGLLLLDWFGRVKRPASEPERSPWPPAPAWVLLAPFFHGRPIPTGGAEPLHLAPEPSWPQQLASGRVRDVLQAASLRLRMAKLAPAILSVEATALASPPSSRLGAALLVPLSTGAVRRMLHRVAPPPIDEEVAP